MSDLVSFQDVLAARERLTGIAHRTPVMTSRTLDALCGRQIFLKCENFQRGGAFKLRGAYNAISRLSDDERRRGVLAFSSGNHAQGVALAARFLGIPAVIGMPDDAPAVKVAATRGYGAEVLFYDRMKDNREEVGQQLVERGLSRIHPFDNPHIIAGQGTATLELLEDVPDLDALVVPISGGGLISGAALAAHGIRSAIRVFGVEPADGDDTQRSLLQGHRIEIAPPKTIADGLRSTTPGVLTFPIMQAHVESVVTVSDDEIMDAIRFALLRMKIVLEPSGATGLAALMFGRLPPDVQRVGIILSGGNIDPPLLERVITH